MPWMTGAAIIGGSLISGSMQADAAGDAAAGQAAATAGAIGEQRRQYNQTRQDTAPWRQVGGSAVYRLADLLGLGNPKASNDILSRYVGGEWSPQSTIDSISGLYGSDSGKVRDLLMGSPTDASGAFNTSNWGDTLAGFTPAGTSSADSGSLLKEFTGADLQNEPGYQFQLAEGNKAIENAARARGTYFGPSTVQELLRYGTDYAGTKYQDAWNRNRANKGDTFNMLSGVAGAGQTAVNSVASSGMGSASNIGQLMTGGANARGAAGIAGANAIGGAITGAGNYFANQSILDRILNRGGGGGFYPGSYGGPIVFGTTPGE